MRICVPTRDDRGLDAEPYGHFGSAPYFTLVETESGAVEVLSNANRHHAHGACHPMRQLADHPVDAVVCRGMGQRAVIALRDAGIDVLIADGPNVGAVVEALRERRLRPLSPGEACEGHRH